MLGISQNREDGTRCRYCGEKLSLLQRLSRAEYCNAQHKEQYHRDQEKLALDRLQQVVAEGREAEVFGRLSRGKPKLEPPPGTWPEEMPQPRTSGKAVYEDPYEAANIGPPMCGPICTTDIAAAGLLAPSPPGRHAEEITPSFGRMPETPLELPLPGVHAAPGVQLGFTVPVLEGERRGRRLECNETHSTDAIRFPALSIQSVDWSEAMERAKQAWAGIPPLAGLIQIAGPQTLRFQARPRTPMPLPEPTQGSMVRAYKPGLSGGAGVPGLAGAIRGLGTWRTRFGSEGSLKPQWEADALETPMDADVKPRFPAFYTTTPWDGEGLEKIFGLGPGNGPGPETEPQSPPPAPRAVDGPLAYRALGSAERARTETEWSRPSGPSPGSFKGKAPVNPIADAPAAGSGSGDGRGAVSVEAVAALVKAARQSDRSRAPLRDIEIKLLNRPAGPKFSAARPWRGLTEGGARSLPGRGPIWNKAPYPLGMARLEALLRSVAAEPVAGTVEPCAASHPASLDVCLGLYLAAQHEWNEAWLRPVVGSREMRPVAGSASFGRPGVSVPQHRVPAPAAGGASQLQPVLELPEPWVEVQEPGTVLASTPLEPVTTIEEEPRRPAWPVPAATATDRNLGLGAIEKPGGQWVLLRGSSEAATFRLALDHLRLQEPGGPRETEWGPVGSSRQPRPAGLAPSRAIVHRDLSLQRIAAEPLLEPLICQFGSARGGLWDSRT